MFHGLPDYVKTKLFPLFTHFDDDANERDGGIQLLHHLV